MVLIIKKFYLNILTVCSSYKVLTKLLYILIIDSAVGFVCSGASVVGRYLLYVKQIILRAYRISANNTAQYH